MQNDELLYHFAAAALTGLLAATKGDIPAKELPGRIQQNVEFSLMYGQAVVAVIAERQRQERIRGAQGGGSTAQEQYNNPPLNDPQLMARATQMAQADAEELRMYREAAQQAIQGRGLPGWQQPAPGPLAPAYQPAQQTQQAGAPAGWPAGAGWVAPTAPSEPRNGPPPQTQQGLAVSDSGEGRWLGDTATVNVWADPSRNPRRFRTGQAAINHSVAAMGRVMVPIQCVREPGPNGEPYRVVVGYGRLEAAKQGGIVTIPVVVDEFPETVGSATGDAVSLPKEASRSLGALAENMVREDMGSWDIAAAIGKLSGDGLNALQIAILLTEEGGRKVMAPHTVREYIKIAQLPPECLTKLQSMGSTGYTLAKRLATVPGLRMGDRWRPPETIAKMNELLAALVPAAEVGGKSADVPSGKPRTGWRWSSAAVRSAVAKLESRGVRYPWLSLLAFAAGSEEHSEEAERLMGPETLAVIQGKKKLCHTLNHHTRT